VQASISDFTNPEKHHIFPQAYLKNNMAGQAEVHALPNFCFLPAELNKRISDSKPSEYFPILKLANTQFEMAARTHLLPIDSSAGIWNDDYLEFLKERSKLILEEIERLTGRSTSPRGDQRQSTVERIENQLRDFIHGTLVDVHGQDYWNVSLPSDVRDEANRRIALALEKQPALSVSYFKDARERLNFCNLADYLKIVVMKPNWPSFERTFRRKLDVERHFEAFFEYRNALMHSRKLTELTRRAGELAMIWFETTIARENDESPEMESDMQGV
jgi:hypothetical protein